MAASSLPAHRLNVKLLLPYLAEASPGPQATLWFIQAAQQWDKQIF